MRKRRQNAAANSVFGVNTLAFSAQKGLLERFERPVDGERLADACRSLGTNSVAAQAAGKVKTQQLRQNAAANSESGSIR